MSDKPWIDSYTPREWEVYHIPVSNETEFPPTRELDDKLVVCNAESSMAKDAAMTGSHFFVDMELMMTEVPMTAGCGELAQLSEPWNGHAPGSLVMKNYIRILDDPPQFTYLVEQTKAAS